MNPRTVLLLMGLFFLGLPAFAQGITVGLGWNRPVGVQTTKANTWTGTQTFKTAKFLDSDQSNIISLVFGNESADRNLTVPQMGGDSSILLTNAAGNQFVTTGMGFSNTLYLMGGSAAVHLSTNSQSSYRDVLYPTLNSDATAFCGLYGTTSAMSAGSVTVSNANVHTGDKIMLTRISGANPGFTSVSISDGVGFTVTSSSGTDAGVYNYVVVK